MGNEESQQGGAPGQQQQGAPGSFGMGAPQGQPRFGGPQAGPPPGMRQVAPTGRPNLRPGGPGPPQQQQTGILRGAFPGGPGTVPRAQQATAGAPVRPVQVGVQPWAEPPVQQPPHFRGPAPQPQTAPAPLRPQLQQQQQQQQIQQQQKAKQQQMMAEAEMDIGVDLSNLSEEEKARILSVMARAQDLDQDYERHKRAKEEPAQVRVLLCPLCQAVDLAVETNKMCGDCGKDFCQKCGTFVPGEGRRSVWVCNTCSNRRKQQSAAMATQHDTTTYTTAGQKVAGDPGRKDETMSREYPLHPDSVGDVVSIPSARDHRGRRSSRQYNHYDMEEEDEEEDLDHRRRRLDLEEEEEEEVDLEEEDGWGGGFGSSSGGDDEDHGFSDRTSSIRRMLEEEDDDDEEEDAYGSDDDERGGGGGGAAFPFYDRSPGEVYTIPEEEEDAASPMMAPSWDGELLNTDTASSLLRWRGMGQPFQTPQQQQQAAAMQPGGQQHQQQAGMQMSGMQQQQPSVSLLGAVGTGTSGGTSLMSGSLIPSSAVVSGRGAGTIPRTVPLAAVSQQQQWPNAQTTVQPQQQNQWGMQQTGMQQPLMQQQQPTTMQQQQQLQQQQQQQQKQLGPKGMDGVPGSMMMTTGTTGNMMQQQQQQQQQKAGGGGLMMKRTGVESSDWSPVTDLSPILDVSPSLEAAEQELMEKCVQQEQQQTRPSIPRAQSGTISSLLADFNKSVGQTTPTIDDGGGQQRSLLGVVATSQQVVGTITTAMTTASQKTTASAGGTEMDQNQNLVQQHQFQLQQQQLMIQQQQQVIQQQQQQLQHQMQMQNQQQQHATIMQDMQQQQQIQQQQTVTGTLGQQQQQPGVVMGGTTPMQQQQQQTPSHQRKVHRRLPQPTVDQMQAAVALAAQTPRSKSQPPNRGGIGVGTPSSFQRPVSPMAPRTTFESSSASSTTSLLGVVQSSQGLSPSSALSMLTTSAISPTPRKDPDATSSLEGDGGKKVRRRLPPVPLDQEPTTVPLRRTKDRSRTLSMPLSTSADRGAWDTRRMPQRTTSLDDGMSLTKASTSSILDSLGLTSSSTDTYLRLLAARDLAGLFGTTTTGTTGTTTGSILDSIPSSIGLSTSLLGRRDLSAPHSLSLYRDTVIPSSTSASYLLDSSGAMDHPGPPKLPSYILSLKQQLREELRSVSDHNRRRITDPDLSGLLSHSAWNTDGTTSTAYDPLRKMGSSTLPMTSGSRMAAGSHAARRSRHRRHASDTKLSMFTSLGGRDDLVDDPLSRYKLYQGGSTMPFKSYEFESIDDHLGPSYGYRTGTTSALGRSTYPRRSSLTDMRTTTDELRDTAVNSLASSKDPALRRYNRELARLRRHTDTGLGSLNLAGLDPYGRHHGGVYGGHGRAGLGAGGLGRAPRSWHPSPYGSEDEDEREEKKAKIKAEIARRRQHLEESARLHHHHHHSDADPMYKISRGRDPTGYSSPLWSGDRLYTSPISLDSSSQESGQEELLMMRRDAYRNQNYMASTYPAYRNSSSRYGDSSRGVSSSWPYDPYAYADDLADPYDLEVYDSPMLDSESELLAPMPLLPDMPTRSRRLLHDLGSTPLGGPPTRHHSQHHHSRSGVSSSQPYDEYEGRGGGGVEDRGGRPPPQSSDSHHQHHHHQSATNAPPNHLRKAQNSKTSQKYDFPVKRILLTRDPKDRSVSGNGLGMKVVGGKEIPGSNGMIGAYVARIYPGGVVETLGEVREGDQVLEWNGTSLTGKTYEEVQRIIATSGDEVEIVIRSDFNMLSSRSSSHHHQNRHHHHEQQNNHHQSGESRLSRSGGHHHHSSRSGGHHQSSSSSSTYPQQQSSSSYRTSRGGYNYDGGGTPIEEVGVHNSNCADLERCGSTSPTRGYRSSPTRHQRIGSPVGKGDTSDNKEKYRAEDISGEIQLQVCYDSKASILYVTIVRARNLVTSRDNSGLPDPYVKCYLLPDRRVENQRRTRYFSRCSNPEWKQTMVYPQVPQDQLKKKHLEISVWNYDVNRPPEFLGEVILDLKDTSVIDEQSRWYKLHPHDPKKYPNSSQTLNNEGAIKMARLNNPANKTANSLYLDNDDIRKNNNLEKKFFKQLTKKSNVNDSYARVSSQTWRVPSLYTGNITAHPLLPQGCHGAVCTIL